MFKFIPLALLLIAACLVAVIIVRKIPQLSLINIESLPKPKEEEVKERILLERLKRRLDEWRKRWRALLNFLKSFFVKWRELWQKLKALERQNKIKKAPDAQEFIKEAEKKSESSPEESEKIFLDIIANDSKNVGAYEGLTEIYQANKDEEAEKEILKFLLKLNPTNFAKYIFRLAEIAFANKDYEEAVTLVSRLLKKGAVEPKYLDFLIESAIISKQRKIGWSALRILQKINPENGKIEDFEERLRNLPT